MNFRKLTAVVSLMGAICASAAFAGPPTYPFASRIDPYPYGTKPNHVTPAQMDNSIKTHYNAWKAAALVNVPTVPGGKAVRFGGSHLTVSEGMGYGMLILVLMAGHDPQAQVLFDGLLTTVRARPAYSNPMPSGKYLMDWRLAADGSSQSSAGGGWNAMDGDEDIAMALLMADRQWGSTGAWNYKQEGINTINAMKTLNMKSDGTTKGLGSPDISRTSDYMTGHFRAYAKATGDTFWSTTAIDRSYELIDRMQDVYSPGVGLMPEFIVATNTSTPRPSSGGMADAGVMTEMNYFANAQRNPWRWGTDYVHSGDTRWKDVLMKMTKFFVAKTGGNPNNMSIGYQLNGTDMGFAWPARGVIAGAMNGAQVDPSFQPFLNASWDWLNSHFVTHYYDSELVLLSMLVASGNWWNPTSPATQPPPVVVNPPPPPTVPPSATIRIQAENAVRSGVGVRNDVGGYEGSGFAGPFANAGDKLTVNFPAVKAGSHEIRIRYHAWTAQQNTVLVNGTPRTESFPATGSGWATKTISGVALPDGANSVAILKDWGYIDVDYIELVPAASGVKVRIQTQAETGAVSGTGVGVRKDFAGYEGPGFVGGFTTTGDKLTLGFPNVVAGNYNLRVRYHAWGNQQNNVVINGTSRSETFPGTGSGWGVKTISNVALPAGSNSIAIVKDWGYMDVDWVEVAP
jgi:hypothetical protein